MRLKLILILVLFCLAPVSAVWAADTPAGGKPIPFLVPSKSGSATVAAALTSAPPSAGHFAQIGAGDTTWVIDSDGETTAQHAGCSALGTPTPPAIQQEADKASKVRTDSLVPGLILTRDKASDGKSNIVTLELIMSTLLTPQARDDFLRLDAKPFFTDTVRSRVIQVLPVDELKKSLASAKNVTFTFAGGSLKTDAPVIAQVIDKLEACATLKK